MARSWQYPRWRRLAMQGALWLILAGTIGLAAAVDHQLTNGPPVALGEAVGVGEATVELPAGWPQRWGNQADSSFQVEAREPGTQPRLIEIVEHPIDHLLPPVELLAQIGWLTPGTQWSSRAAQIDGSPAVCLSGTRMVEENSGGIEFQRKELLSCTVFPSRQMVAARLVGVGEIASGDEELLSRVMATLHVQREPAVGAGGTLTVGEITLAVPAGFSAEADEDDLRTEAHLISNEGDWTSATLIPCLLMPDDGPGAMKSALAVQDVEWLGATVTNEGSQNWRYDLPVSAAGTFRRAYLQAGPNGWGVLAIWSGTRADAIEQSWAKLGPKVQYDESAENPAPLLEAGAQEVRRLGVAGLGAALGPVARDEWWIEYHQSIGDACGWTHVSFDGPAAELSAHRETRRREGRSVIQATLGFYGDGDLRTYAALATRNDWTGHLFQETLNELFQTGAGRMSCKSSGVLSLDGKYSRLMPAQFLPGGWLPMLIGRLQSRRMILRSEAVVGQEGIAWQDPFTLIVETSQSNERGVASVTIRVNGTGRNSRCYLNFDRSLRSIDLCDGLHLQRVDAAVVRKQFGGDEAMAVDEVAPR